MKLFANQGKVEVQAQNDALDIAANKILKLIASMAKSIFRQRKKSPLFVVARLLKSAQQALNWAVRAMSPSKPLRCKK